MYGVIMYGVIRRHGVTKRSHHVRSHTRRHGLRCKTSKTLVIFGIVGTVSWTVYIYKMYGYLFTTRHDHKYLLLLNSH